LKELEHPNLVRVFDFGRAGPGRAYFTMELLSPVVPQEHWWTGEEQGFLSFMLAVMEGLMHLHNNGWLHSDVKTTNTLLADHDRPDSAKLTDFGLASLLRDAGDLRRGTLEYMAPEVLVGGTVDHKADLYSAGVMFYETWTGNYPFPAESIDQVIKAKRKETGLKSIHVPSDMPGTVRTILDRLLQSDPVFRYPSAQAVINAIIETGPEGLRTGYTSPGLQKVRLLKPGLAGREDDLSELRASFNELVVNGTAPCIVIEGRLGAGKTRLIEEFKRHVQTTGGKIAITDCETGSLAPLEPLRRLVRILAPQNEDGKGLALEELVPEVLSLLPGGLVKPAQPVSENRETFFESIRRLLNELTKEAPHVLVFDDADMADETTMQLLRFLSRAGNASNFLVLCCVDPKMVNQSDRARDERCWWSERQTPALRVLRLRPLALAEVSRLVSSVLVVDRPPAGFVQWVAANSDGVPGRILSGLKSLADREDIVRRRGQLNIELEGFDLSGLDWEDGSEALLELPALNEMEPAFQEIVAGASVLGRSFTLDLLDKLLATDEDRLVLAIDTAVQSGILQPLRQQRGHYRFTSRKTEGALVSCLEPATRKRLYRQAARLMKEEGGSPADIARLHRKGGEKAKAYTYYIKAATQAASLLAHHDAERFCDSALAMSGQGRTWRQKKIDAMERSAEVAAKTGNFTKAVERYCAIVDLLAEGEKDPGRLREIERKKAWFLARQGKVDEAEENLVAILKTIPAPSVTKARILHTLALIKIRKGLVNEGQEWCLKALECLSRAGNDAEQEMIFRTSLASSLIRTGEFKRSHDQNAQALRIAEDLGNLSAESRCHNNLGSMYWYMGHWEKARMAFLKLLECQRQLGDLPGLSVTYTNLGLSSYHLGEWDEASEFQQKSLAVAEQIYSESAILTALNNLGIIYKDRGELDKAQECFDRSMWIALKAQDKIAIAVIEGNLGDLALKRADCERATVHYNRDLGIAREIGMQQEVLQVYRRLAETELVKGEPQKALEQCEKAMELLSRVPSTLEKGILKRVLGVAQYRLNEIDSAQKYFSESIKVLKKDGNVYELAQTFLACGEFERERKRFERAERWLNRADKLLEKLHALPDLERVRQSRLGIQEESKERVRSKWEMLLKAGQALSATLDLERLLVLVMDMVLKVTQAKRGFLMLVDDDGELAFEIARGEVAEATLGEFAISHSVVDQVKQTRKAVVITDISESEAFRKQESILYLGIKSMMCVPLLSKGNFIGIIYVDNRDETIRVFDEEDLMLFEALAGLAAIAIENAKLVGALNRSYDELKRSNTDLENAYQEVKNAQGQLIQAEKMSAMGQLAAGIAHELNQPLSAILGYSEVLLYKGEFSKDTEDMLRTISKESLRMSKLVNNIRIYSRKASTEFALVDVHEPIKEVINLLQYRIRKLNIKMEYRLKEDPIYVQADPNQLQQVFLNLINNAIDALESSEKRSIAIATMLSEKGGVEVTITDTGMGIPKEIMSDIFNPFFTTKSVEKGTGLGLSIILGIVKNHGGRITAQSTPGTGTTFTVWLPEN
ncbi:tetratricopeptide repeat protein, partial [Acidobacteriota bacterium]